MRLLAGEMNVGELYGSHEWLEPQPMMFRLATQKKGGPMRIESGELDKELRPRNVRREFALDGS